MVSILNKLKEDAKKFEKAIVRSIKSVYGDKTTIILFGSRAKGTHSLKSDFDIMIITEKTEDALDKIIQIRKNIPKKQFGLDLVVVTPNEIENPTIRQMLKHMKILYDGLGLTHKLQRLNP